MCTLSNVSAPEGEPTPSNVSPAADIPSEAKNIRIGVSVKYVHDPSKKWYVLRATYGREKSAYEYIINDGTQAYLPQRYVKKVIQGKTKRILQPLILNLLFVYCTEEKITDYVKRTPCLSYLRFYYDKLRINAAGLNPPLTIPYDKMISFINATSVDNDLIMLVSEDQIHYKSGDKVRVIEGKFAGVEGRVARVAGQQRVIVELNGICLIATAYIPTAFLMRL